MDMVSQYLKTHMAAGSAHTQNGHGFATTEISRSGKAWPRHITFKILHFKMVCNLVFTVHE